MTTRILATCATVALVSCLSACGSGGSDGGRATPPPFASQSAAPTSASSNNQRTSDERVPATSSSHSEAATSERTVSEPDGQPLSPGSTDRTCGYTASGKEVIARGVATSCGFAMNVARAADASPAADQVTAVSPATGRSYVMTREPGAHGDDYVGGKNARVWIGN